MISLNERVLRLEEVMPLVQEHLAQGQSVRFAPRGVSMLPLLRQGKDKVVLSPVTEPLKKYDLPLYQRDNGQFVLHRIVKAGETFTCMGDNQHVPEPGIRRDQIIAVVTKIVRGRKEIDVTCWQYGLYCRAWHLLRPVKRILGKVKRYIKRP